MRERGVKANCGLVQRVVTLSGDAAPGKGVRHRAWEKGVRHRAWEKGVRHRAWEKGTASLFAGAKR